MMNDRPGFVYVTRHGLFRVSFGDAAGIGIELALHSLAAAPLCHSAGGPQSIKLRLRIGCIVSTDQTRSLHGAGRSRTNMPQTPIAQIAT